MSKNRSPEQWSKILAAYRNRSGSMVEFCEARQISPATLGYQLRKSRKPKNTSPNPPRLVELSPSPPPNFASTASPNRIPDGITELALTHRALGHVTLRCEARVLSVVIAELSKSTSS
jgi:hypothetical protein